jgi:RNA polymerase sigma factor (sigma-70 family)
MRQSIRLRDPEDFLLAQQRLTAQEERELVIAAECGDDAACRKLVEAFLPAIANLARGFQGSRVERRELLQEGVAGLLFAARRYDAELDTPFWAYASFWVRKAMQELVAALTRPVALSDRATRELSHIRRTRNEHLQRHGREPTIEELHGATDLTPAQLESLLATERIPRGLEDRLGADDPSSPTVGETIADPVAEQAYEKVLDDLEIHGVLDLTDQLDERERAVIRSHYGLGQEQRTLKEIGAGLGLTAERARQIEAAALAKLRQALAQPAAVSTGI